MNYPLGEAILGFAGGSRLDMGVVRGHDQYRLDVRPLDGPAFAARVMELAAAYDPDVVGGPAQPPRLARHARGCGPCWAATSPGVRLAMLLQATLPGAPCIYYGDEIGLARRQRSGEPRRASRGTRRAGSPACATRSGRCSASGRPSRPCATARCGSSARRDRRSPSSAAPGRRASSSRSTPATRSRRPRAPASRDAPGGAGGHLAADRAARVRALGRDADRRRRARRSTSPRGPAASSGSSTRAGPGVGVDFGHTPRSVADLPIDLGARARRAAWPVILDVEAKIPRTLEALGPVGGRDVLLLDGADGIRARQLTELGGRVTFAEGERTGRVRRARRVGRLSSSACGRSFRDRTGARRRRGGPRPATRRAPARGPRLRPRRRLAAARRPPRVRAAGAVATVRSCGGGFKVRVVHCFWTFESIDDAPTFLDDGVRRRRARGGGGDEASAPVV